MSAAANRALAKPDRTRTKTTQMAHTAQRTGFDIVAFFVQRTIRAPTAPATSVYIIGCPRPFLKHEGWVDAGLWSFAMGTLSHVALSVN